MTHEHIPEPGDRARSLDDQAGGPIRSAALPRDVHWAYSQGRSQSAGHDRELPEFDPEGDDMAERRFFLRGDIDLANAPALQAELVAVYADNDDDLAVDCRGLTFIDSSGLAVLTAAAATLQADGRSFRILNADDFAERLFELIGLADVLHVNDGDQAHP